MRFGAALTVCLLGATLPAVGQERDWRGGYAGLTIGVDSVRDDATRPSFDTDLDRAFAERGAVDPAGCAAGAADDCRREGARTGYGAYVGYDLQFGDIVVGAVGETGRTSIVEPNDVPGVNIARYAFSRSVDWTGQARLRAGYALGDSLPYVTGGAALARIDHGFARDDAADRHDRSDARGYVVGGGIDQRVSDTASIGLLYTFTNVRDTVGGTRSRSAGRLARSPGGPLKWHSARVRASFRF